jgi:hypothetical protein
VESQPCRAEGKMRSGTNFLRDGKSDWPVALSYADGLQLSTIFVKTRTVWDYRESICRQVLFLG